jgi:monothiol glutaredoxin
MVEILQKQELKFKCYNVLDEWQLKEWLKFYSNFPNFPQMYIQGRLIGSTEMVQQLIEFGKFNALIPT